MPKKNTENKILATNKKAFHNYHIIEQYEAGIVLSGYEVKSARLHNLSLVDSTVRFSDSEAFMENVYIAPYTQISTHVTDYESKEKENFFYIKMRL